MAKSTWTKSKCSVCGNVRRYRGAHRRDDERCPDGGVYQWTEVHWGQEKYAQTCGRAGTVQKRGDGSVAPILSKHT